MKRCPKCTLPAPLDATVCAQCGHQYSTKFGGQSAANNSSVTVAIPAQVPLQSPQAPNPNTSSAQASPNTPGSLQAATMPMPGFMFINLSREASWLPRLRSLFFYAAFAIWLVGLAWVGVGASVVISQQTRSQEQAAAEAQQRAKDEADQKQQDLIYHREQVARYIANGYSSQDAERMVQEDEKADVRTPDFHTDTSPQSRENSPAPNLKASDIAEGFSTGLKGLAVLLTIIGGAILFGAIGGLFMFLSCCCGWLAVRLVPPS